MHEEYDDDFLNASQTIHLQSRRTYFNDGIQSGDNIMNFLPFRSLLALGSFASIVEKCWSMSYSNLDLNFNLSLNAGHLSSGT